MIKKAYIDMDGVLADLTSKMEEVRCSFDPTSPYFVNHREFFETFIKNQYFKYFNKLPFQKILDFLINKEIELEVLSSIGSNKNMELVDHKTYWIEQHYPNTFLKLNFVPGKKLKRKYASNDAILIDDHPANINDFIISGGLGILHESEEKTLEILKTFF
jgi:hypothetical protein